MNALNHHRLRVLALGLAGWLVVGCTTIRPQAPAGLTPSELEIFSHEHFDRVLQTHVDPRGRVAYAALKADPADLETYYALVAAYSPDSHPEMFPTTDHKLAYWINAYNAATIKTVLTYYPIASVQDVKKPGLFFFMPALSGFFFFQRPTFGGQTTSLYYLENQVIWKRFGDPRFHFAVNCASLGCPRLPNRAFRGTTLDQQLDHETRRFLAEARNFRIDHEAQTIYLSAIFEWYHDHFTQWLQTRFPDREASLPAYIALYLPPAQAAILREIGGRYALRHVPYDWGLNDQAAAP